MEEEESAMETKKEGPVREGEKWECAVMDTILINAFWSEVMAKKILSWLKQKKEFIEKKN